MNYLIRQTLSTKLNTLKNLVKIVSNKTEKERINNVIKSVEFVLDQIAFDKNVSYSNSDNEQDSFDFKFSGSDNKQDSSDSESSNTKGSG